MDPQQLKQALAEDMKIIKTLNPDIIPARSYYGDLLKGVFSGFWKMFIILFLTLCYIMGSDKTDPITWSELFTTSCVISFFLSTIAMLILFRPISFFVQFRFHLEKKLKTGAIIRKKCSHISMIFFGVFAFLCILFGSYAEGTQILFMLVLSFFLSLGATNLVVNMELSRIGFECLFTLFNEFFSKGKTIPIEETHR